jgi:hypothetical protein
LLQVSKTKFLDRFGFLAQNAESFKEKYQIRQTLREEKIERGEVEGPSEVATLDDKKVLKLKRRQAIGKLEDPILSILDPSYNIGAVSESWEKSLNNFLEKGMVDRFDRFDRSKVVF